MTEQNRAAMNSEIASLLADNTSGAITAANVRQVFTDSVASYLSLLDDTLSTVIPGTITFATTQGIQTATTATNTMLAKVYDTTNSLYRTFLTCTANTTPTVAFAQPTNTTLTWDGGAIGTNTAAAGNFTTIGATTPGSGVFTSLTASTAKTDYQLFVPATTPIINSGAGTMTITRNALGNYSYVHTVAANIPVLAYNLTNEIRTTSSKGFELTSIDFVYQIGAANMTAHTVSLNATAFTNNSAVVVTNLPLTGSLQTATQASPYVTNLTVTTPAFNNTTDSTYTLELTANCATTTTYQIWGFYLNFTKNTL